MSVPFWVCSHCVAELLESPMLVELIEVLPLEPELSDVLALGVPLPLGLLPFGSLIEAQATCSPTVEGVLPSGPLWNQLSLLAATKPEMPRPIAFCGTWSVVLQ